MISGFLDEYLRLNRRELVRLEEYFQQGQPAGPYWGSRRTVQVPTRGIPLGKRLAIELQADL